MFVSKQATVTQPKYTTTYSCYVNLIFENYYMVVATSDLAH